MIRYEWDIETINSDGDIIDHQHSDKLAKLPPLSPGQMLVLIRDTGNELDGLQDRLWAYVNEGQLPLYFVDANGQDTQVSVPRKYHIELSKL